MGKVNADDVVGENAVGVTSGGGVGKRGRVRGSVDNRGVVRGEPVVGSKGGSKQRGCAYGYGVLEGVGGRDPEHKRGKLGTGGMVIVDGEALLRRHMGGIGEIKGGDVLGKWGSSLLYADVCGAYREVCELALGGAQVHVVWDDWNGESWREGILRGDVDRDVGGWRDMGLLCRAVAPRRGFATALAVDATNSGLPRSGHHQLREGEWEGVWEELSSRGVVGESGRGLVVGRGGVGMGWGDSGGIEGYGGVWSGVRRDRRVGGRLYRQRGEVLWEGVNGGVEDSGWWGRHGGVVKSVLLRYGWVGGGRMGVGEGVRVVREHVWDEEVVMGWMSWVGRGRGGIGGRLDCAAQLRPEGGLPRSCAAQAVCPGVVPRRGFAPAMAGDTTNRDTTKSGRHQQAVCPGGARDTTKEGIYRELDSVWGGVVDGWDGSSVLREWLLCGDGRGEWMGRCALLRACLGGSGLSHVYQWRKAGVEGVDWVGWLRDQWRMQGVVGGGEAVDWRELRAGDREMRSKKLALYTDDVRWMQYLEEGGGVHGGVDWVDMRGRKSLRGSIWGTRVIDEVVWAYSGWGGMGLRGPMFGGEGENAIVGLVGLYGGWDELGDLVGRMVKGGYRKDLRGVEEWLGSGAMGSAWGLRGVRGQAEAMRGLVRWDEGLRRGWVPEGEMGGGLLEGERIVEEDGEWLLAMGLNEGDLAEIAMDIGVSPVGWMMRGLGMGVGEEEAKRVAKKELGLVHVKWGLMGKELEKWRSGA